MADDGDVTIVTYNGIDGACAAAMALLRFPQAQVQVSSARRIGAAFAELASRLPRGAAVHVCGLGVYCDWEELHAPARALRDKDVDIQWYCGRGYLARHRERLARFCTPVFLDRMSNTDAVCDHLGLREDEVAARLVQVARHDPHLEHDWPEPGVKEEFWADLINAAIADYFKYQDERSYVDVIRKLSRMRCDADDRRAVEVFRRAGFKHVLWGKSAPMRRLRDTIRRCAEVDEPVLILGESGVGKEYVAHLIHERSRRAMGPLVPVNCGLFAGNAGLADSTLFGHIKGAFTGAREDRDGAFATADSGILFLDELGELPPEVQAKLLRVLEDGRITPVGSDRPRRVDVRVIAATNRDLPAMIRAGEFRSDLYHRLDVLQIAVPPLREHLEDIEAIVRQVLPSLADGRRQRLSRQELADLQDYHWPGNVRQLIKVLKRAVLLERPLPEVLDEERRLGGLVEGADEEGTGPLWPRAAGQVRPIRQVRDAYAARALELHGGNRTTTAQALGVAPNTLRKYLDGD